MQHSKFSAFSMDLRKSLLTKHDEAINSSRTTFYFWWAKQWGVVDEQKSMTGCGRTLLSHAHEQRCLWACRCFK